MFKLEETSTASRMVGQVVEANTLDSNDKLITISCGEKKCGTKSRRSKDDDLNAQWCDQEIERLKVIGTVTGETKELEDFLASEFFKVASNSIINKGCRVPTVTCILFIAKLE